MRRVRESMQAFQEVFRNDGLRKLELGWAGSILGAWAYTVGISFYTYQHGGATAVGVLSAARWMAAALVSPFASVFGDRHPRRFVMISSDLLRGSLIAVAAVLIAADAPAAIVYVVSILITAAVTPFRAAEAALTPSLARTPDELTAANVVSSTIESFGLFGGPAIGGLVLAGFGTVTLLATTVGAHLWSALLVWLIRVDEKRPEPAAEAEHESLWSEFTAGFRTIAKESKLRILVGLYTAQMFVDGILNVLIIVIALKLLEEKAAVGYLNSAVGIGGLIGAVVTAALVSRRRLATDFGIGIFIWGLPVALLAIWPHNLAPALLLLGVLGVGNTIVDVFSVTLMQRSAPEGVISRVFGVLEGLSLAAIALGALLAPAILALIGTRATMVAAGVLLPVLVLPAWSTLLAIDRTAQIPTDRIELLRRISIFAPLPEPVIERLAAQLQTNQAPAGTTIFRQGDEGDRFFVIADGAVQVHPAEGGTVRLGPGDFFGEIALLRDVPRTATVVALEDTHLYSLNWDTFVPAVTGYAPSRTAAETVIGTRLGTTAGVAPA